MNIRNEPIPITDLTVSIVRDMDNADERLGVSGDFNKPWMDNINPELLRRYWIKKGMPKPLVTYHYGMKIRSYGTPLGIIDCSVGQLLFK